MLQRVSARDYKARDSCVGSSLWQVLWPRSRVSVFGSNATGLALPMSDVDILVHLPPVRNLVSQAHDYRTVRGHPGLLVHKLVCTGRMIRM